MENFTESSATAFGSVRKSDCVPIKTIDACDLRKFGAHFFCIDANVSGLTTEKHNKNTSLSG